MMYRATYYVTLMVDAPVSGDTFAEAVESAKKKSFSSLVKVKPGIDNIDTQVQLSSVNDMSVNGEM
jgi:hypothetical protein